MNTYIYIYVCTSVLQCVYTHSECGSICQVDAIVMLIWSKVCITKAITISITISIQKLSSTFNHTIQKLSFVENWSDSWKTGRILGKLVGFQENWSDLWKLVGFLKNWSDSWKTGQICGNWSDSWKTGQIPGNRVRFVETGQIVELVEVLKTGENAVPVHKSWPEEGGNGREDEKKKSWLGAFGHY